MANAKNSTVATSSAMPPPYLPPLVVAQSCLDANRLADNNAHFAERALTISRGAKVLSDILHMDIVERDSGRNPVLAISSIEALAGFLSESMFMLGEMAEKRLDDINCDKP